VARSTLPARHLRFCGCPIFRALRKVGLFAIDPVLDPIGAFNIPSMLGCKKQIELGLQESDLSPF
jgi:hypothetical protein